uniref:Uncharacterized protein n=1 Tax=Arundo donax TaxID=35708 RepID=A0A0A8ZUF6_ARUDO
MRIRYIARCDLHQLCTSFYLSGDILFTDESTEKFYLQYCHPCTYT